MTKEYTKAIVKLLRDEPEETWHDMIERARELKNDAAFVCIVERWYQKDQEEAEAREALIEVLMMGCHPIRSASLYPTVTATEYRAVIRDLLMKGEHHA